MAATQIRKSVIVMKVEGGFYKPNTELLVQLKTDEVSPALVATGVENSPGSGDYWTELFTPIKKYGYWYVSGAKQAQRGKVWLGHEVLQYTFLKVKVFDSGDSPTGARGAPRTFTSGTSPLASDSSGLIPEWFAHIVSVTVDGAPYQERGVYLANVPSLSSGNVTFQTEVSDAGNDSGDAKSYADIIIKAF